MIQACKRAWRQLTAGKAGNRFQERYARRRQTSRGRVHKGFVILAGGVLIAIGIVLLPAPGPGVLVVIAGATLIAQESLAAARLLDRAELRLRRVFRRK